MSTVIVRFTIASVMAAAPNRKPSYVDAVLAAATENDGVILSMTTEAYDAIKAQFSFCGPGCQLRRTLSWFIRDDGTCGCTEYAAQMDSWGPDGCEERLDEIVAHLLEQAAKRSIFLGAVPAAAVIPLVRRAIAAARAEATPATPPPG
jgi:hypothetical protein